MTKRLIPEDSFDVQVLFDAMEKYSDAKAEHDKARDEYDGYSWGWYGADYVDRMESASLKVKELLNKYIDTRVKEAILEHFKKD